MVLRPLCMVVCWNAWKNYHHSIHDAFRTEHSNLHLNAGLLRRYKSSSRCLPPYHGTHVHPKHLISTCEPNRRSNVISRKIH